MKRIFALLLLLVFSAPGALAAPEGYWTSNEDWYFHASEFCGGAGNMVPISAEGAAEFGKHPCPVCVPGSMESEIWAAAANQPGLLVVCIPDARVREREDFAPGASGLLVSSYSGENAYRALESYMYGEDYIRFLAEYRANGLAETSCARPAIWHVNGADMQSLRCIGGNWYITARSASAQFTPIAADLRTGDEWTLDWRADIYQLCMEGGVLTADHTDAALSEVLTLRADVRAAETVFEQDYGDVSICVVEVRGVYAALIRCPADEEVVRAELCIGGRSAIPLFATGGAGTGLFSCVLTGAELDALRGGARVELRLMEAEL